MTEVSEMDTLLSVKKITQNIKTTTSNLERLDKSEITIQEMNMKAKVLDTKYTIVYKVKISPTKKLIVKKIIRHR